MNIGFVVDSGCDLRALRDPYNARYDFTRVAIRLDVGDTEFVDDLSLNVPEFLDFLSKTKGRTGSAAPSPEEYFQAFSKSEEVYCVTITGSLSGSYSSAMLGKKMFLEAYPTRKIHVIDSLSTGPEMSLLIEKLISLKEAGCSFEETVAQMKTYQVKNTHLLYVLCSLENLVRNGRVSRLKAGVAGILGIKMLGTASEEGTLSLLHKCRGALSAYTKTYSEMLQMGYLGARVIISHCMNPEIAEYLKNLILKDYPSADITIMPTSGLDSYYAEPGGILVGFETN